MAICPRLVAIGFATGMQLRQANTMRQRQADGMRLGEASIIWLRQASGMWQVSGMQEAGIEHAAGAGK